MIHMAGLTANKLHVVTDTDDTSAVWRKADIQTSMILVLSLVKANPCRWSYHTIGACVSTARRETHGISSDQWERTLDARELAFERFGTPSDPATLLEFVELSDVAI